MSEPAESRSRTRALVASGRIRRRLALAIVLTALIPVLVAVWLADSMVSQTAAKFFVPEIGVRLDQSLELYQELARAVKASMRHAASAIAADRRLRDAALARDAQGAQAALEPMFARYPSLVSLEVLDADGQRLARADRGRPLDEQKENKLQVARPLTDEPDEAAGGSGDDDDDSEQASGPRLVAVFAAEKARFDQLGEMSQFVDTYKQVEQRRQADQRSYLYAFAALLGITIVAAVGVGTLLARGVSSRLGILAEATGRVGAGDLSTRVPERGEDEIAELARAFNRMLGEVETSRARIEYLQRIGAWQEMARRLAHEIKNPLTPIQLAVQEVHRRYDGSDEKFGKLLDTTLEIVEDEVGTLRRLVTEFSNFARLPHAELEELDFGELLAEQRDQLALPDEAGESLVSPGVSVAFELPDLPTRVYMDRQMFRRALINLLRNAVQAVASSGRVVVHLARDEHEATLHVDDDGPGIDPELRDAIFDPYVTTKSEGTGLGLAIVKKIVVEHGGFITAGASPLGGARFTVRLPLADTHAGQQLRDAQPAPSSRRAGAPPTDS
ncbi:MAG: HAMP domain-containing protein [Polyangiaceae bacterium]|nr:HAMP domain-containing protein [Polyangiaceae bacterium]